MPHKTIKDEPVASNRWITASALFLAAFVSLLDVTVVNIALPRVADDLSATDTQTQWVLLAYLVPFAATLLPLGRFGDLLGRRRLFLFGTSGFAIGALMAGTAGTIESLLTARLLQGLSAGAMMPQVLALTHVIMPPDEKARAIGYFGMVSALGAVAGPIIGGAVLTLDIAGLGWRSAFLMVVPLCMVAAATVAKTLPGEAKQSLTSIDLGNSLLIGLTIALFVFAMVQGRAFGWPIGMLGLFPLSVLLGIWAINNQLKRSEAGRICLIPRDLMVSAHMQFGMVIILLLFAGIAGIPFVLALALQAEPAFSPADVAVALVMHPAGAALSAFMAGRIHWSNLWLKPGLGAGLTLLGTVWVRHVLVHGDQPLSPLDFTAPLLLIGLGIGATTVSLFQILLSKVPGDVAGVASGMLQTTQQIGITISIAVVGTLYFGPFAGLPSQLSDTSLLRAGDALWFPLISLVLVVCLCGIGAIRFHRDHHTPMQTH